MKIGLLFIFFICLNFIYGFDFVFEENYIYKLSSSNININNDIVEISYDDSNFYELNRSIISDFGKFVASNKLGYYYHTNKYKDYIKNVLELVKDGDLYKAVSTMTNYDNCFLIVKNISNKQMNTKSSAVMLYIDGLSNVGMYKAYLSCLSKKDYIE